MIERIMFVGSKHLGLRSAEAMYRIAPDALRGIVTIDDRADVRCKLSAFEEFAHASDLRLEVLTKPSGLERLIADVQPQMCVVVGWYWMLKPDLLARVPKGFLGVHPSLLPKYRGGSPLVWAMLNGERETGLSLFYFDDGMDTGDVVAQRRLPILATDTIGDLLAKAEAETADLLEATVPQLIDETAPRQPQDHSQATYGALRTPEDGKLDWSDGRDDICNQIRAQTHPYPGAFTHRTDGTRVCVWAASPFPTEYFGSPGQVVQVADDGVVVTCGRGAVVLHRVQPEDGGEVDACKVFRFGERLR